MQMIDRGAANAPETVIAKQGPVGAAPQEVPETAHPTPVQGVHAAREDPPAWPRGGPFLRGFFGSGN